MRLSKKIGSPVQLSYICKTVISYMTRLIIKLPFYSHRERKGDEFQPYSSKPPEISYFIPATM
jgi:hypothetical protein